HSLSPSYHLHLIPQQRFPNHTFLLHHPHTTHISTLSLTTLFRSQNDGVPNNTKNTQHHRNVRRHRDQLGKFYSHANDYRLQPDQDRKSTRLNSSHEWISYAVFCLKKKSYSYWDCYCT